MEVAITRIVTSRILKKGHPKKSSNVLIPKLVNHNYDTNIATKTASMMIRDTRALMSPKTRGPSKNIPPQVWNLLKGAFVSFIKLQ